MRNLAVRALDQFRNRKDRVPEPLRPEAARLVGLLSEIVKRFRAIYEGPLHAKRIRCHGDFHLGEVLFTGKDFLFIDFEGEPGRPMGERRIKRTPLRDVASMMRSFNYISIIALLKQIELGTVQDEALASLEPWADFWSRWVSAIFLKGYLQALGDSDLLPRPKQQLAMLLEAHLLEKALQEAEYELNNRPHLLRIPLRALLHMLPSKELK